MTRVTCNECGKDLRDNTRHIINTHKIQGCYSYSSSPIANTPETLDFCSYKCINHYTFKRLAE